MKIPYKFEIRQQIVNYDGVQLAAFEGDMGLYLGLALPPVKGIEWPMMLIPISEKELADLTADPEDFNAVVLRYLYSDRENPEYMLYDMDKEELLRNFKPKYPDHFPLK